MRWMTVFILLHLSFEIIYENIRWIANDEIYHEMNATKKNTPIEKYQKCSGTITTTPSAAAAAAAATKCEVFKKYVEMEMVRQAEKTHEIKSANVMRCT